MMVFEGSLAELQLADLVQLMGVSRKTGVLRITNDSRRGDVHFVEGRIVHAQVGGVVGDEAVYALAMSSAGHFEFEPGLPVERRTVSKGNAELLMEAARRLDEWRLVSQKVPSLDLVPEFVPRPSGSGAISLNAAEWLVLSKVDGRRDVRAVAAGTRLSPFVVSKVLYGLVTAHLVRLENAAGRPSARRHSTSEGPAKRAAGTAVVRTDRASRALVRLERVRDVCSRALGSSGQGVVARHCDEARREIERGGGPEATWGAVDQIAKAAATIKGPHMTEQLLQQLSSLD